MLFTGLECSFGSEAQGWTVQLPKHIFRVLGGSSGSLRLLCRREAAIPGIHSVNKFQCDSASLFYFFIS